MKSWAPTATEASSIASSVAPGFPYSMFSRMVPLKRYGVCSTTPMNCVSEPAL